MGEGGGGKKYQKRGDVLCERPLIRLIEICSEFDN